MLLNSELVSDIKTDGVTFTIAKGTSDILDVYIYDEDGNVVTPGSNSSLKLSVKRSIEDSATVINLSFEILNDHFRTNINTSHTANLSPGRYFYDVMYKDTNAYFYQVIPTSYFYILPSCVDSGTM